jgi:site-specific DNA recombinase
MRKRRATGRCEGRKPFGEHPGEQAVLHRIRQLHRKPRGRERLSCAEIAARLNAERLLTPTGTRWRAGTVRRILRRTTVSS